MKITRDTSLLRSRKLCKRGPIWRALRPLLGNGPITADADHARLREQLGNALHKITGWREAVYSYPLPETGARFDLGPLVEGWIEHIMLTVLFEAPTARRISHLIRRCVQLAPLRILGIPADRWHLRALNRALDELPTPSWMPECTPTEKRDWLATMAVAAEDTTRQRVLGSLVGQDVLPIWFVPRQTATGENVIILLDKATMFGAGARKCIGEQIARQVEALCLDRLQVRVIRGDFRRTGLLTRGIRSAFVERV